MLTATGYEQLAAVAGGALAARRRLRRGRRRAAAAGDRCCRRRGRRGRRRCARRSLGDWLRAGSRARHRRRPRCCAAATLAAAGRGRRRRLGGDRLGAWVLADGCSARRRRRRSSCSARSRCRGWPACSCRWRPAASACATRRSTVALAAVVGAGPRRGLALALRVVVVRRRARWPSRSPRPPRCSLAASAAGRAVPRCSAQRRLPAPRTAPARSSSSRRTTRREALPLFVERFAAHRPRAARSSTTRRPTAPASSPTSSPPSGRGCTSCTAPRKDGSAWPTAPASPGAWSAATRAIGQMDCDLSHPPEKLAEMRARLDDRGAGLVLGSRYLPGGGTDGWSRTRLRAQPRRLHAALALVARPAVLRPQRRLQALARDAPGATRPRRRCSRRLRLPGRDDAARPPAGHADRGGPVRLLRARRRRVEDDAARSRWRASASRSRCAATTAPRAADPGLARSGPVAFDASRARSSVDRALASGAGSRRFESCRARHPGLGGTRPVCRRETFFAASVATRSGGSARGAACRAGTRSVGSRHGLLGELPGGDEARAPPRAAVRRRRRGAAARRLAPHAGALQCEGDRGGLGQRVGDGARAATRRTPLSFGLTVSLRTSKRTTSVPQWSPSAGAVLHVPSSSLCTPSMSFVVSI